MFTGLVEEVGKLKGISRQGEAMQLLISASIVMEDVKLGDSISVNGVCLTVTSFDRRSFAADVMPETYRRSSLHRLNLGDSVNLERAMQVGARFGGHIVQGHIDGIGKIVTRENDANAVVFRIEPEDAFSLKYVVPKGSITIDGISLTVVDTAEHSFTVSIIPHTLSQTALQYKQPGDITNLECDIIGKYVDHLLNFKERESAITVKPRSAASKISTAYLAEHGFI